VWINLMVLNVSWTGTPGNGKFSVVVRMAVSYRILIIFHVYLDSDVYEAIVRVVMCWQVVIMRCLVNVLVVKPSSDGGVR
jgi:hypothetical protein